MKKVVIAGSASLEKEAVKWKRYWEEQGYEVLDYPRSIPSESFIQDYPKVFQSFFEHLAQADLVFVMNEGKNGAPGYIGAETFAELAYAVYLRMKTNGRPDIILMQMPQKEMRGSEEIMLWDKVGMIRYL